jgi:aminopeptidase N
MKLVLGLYEAAAAGAPSAPLEERCAAAGGVPADMVAAYKSVLTDDKLDGAFKAMALRLPSMSEIVDRIDEADPVLVWQVRQYVYQQLARQLRPELEAVIAANDVPPGTPYAFNAAESGRRSARNMAESILGSLPEPDVQERLLTRFREATNMTDRMAALQVICEHDTPGRKQALQEFYEANKDKPLTLLKWLVTQASSCMPGNVANVRALMEHPAFVVTNPNCCYSLFLGFARSVNFHAPDGSGYEFVGDAVIKMDKINHQVASRVASAFTTFKQYDKERQAMMVAQLRRIAATNGLSENVFEIVSKSLQQADAAATATA